MKDRDSLSKQAIYLMAGRTAGYAFSFILPLILIRIFAPNEYGLYRQIFLLHATFLPILQLGVTRSLFYFFRREQEQRGIVILQTFLFLSLSSAFFLIIFNLCKAQIGSFFHSPEIETYILPLSIFIFFTGSASFLETLLIVEERVKLASIVIILSDVLRTGLIIGAVLVTRSILFILYAVITFSIIRYTILIIYIYKTYGFPFRKITKKFLSDQFSYAFPLGLAGMISNVGRRVDQYVVSFFFDASMFAIYSVGRFQIPLLNILMTSVGNIVLPKMAEHQKEQRIEELIKLYYNTVRKLALVYLPTFIFFLVISKEFIVTLFTERYVESVPIFIIGLYWLLLRINISGNILEAYGETKYVLKYTIFIVSFNLILMYVFVRNLGLIGPLLARAVGGTIGVFILFYKTKRLLNLSFSKILPWKTLADIFFVSSVSGVVIYLLKGFIKFPGLIMLILCFLVYSAVYGLLAFKFLLKDNEIRTMSAYFVKARNLLVHRKVSI